MSPARTTAPKRRREHKINMRAEMSFALAAASLELAA